ARSREQPEYHGVSRQDVPLVDPRCVTIELEHGGVELEHIFRSDLGGTRRLGADDRLEIVRHFGRARWHGVFEGRQSRKHQTDAAGEYRSMLHEFLHAKNVTRRHTMPAAVPWLRRSW